MTTVKLRKMEAELIREKARIEAELKEVRELINQQETISPNQTKLF